MNIIDLFDQVRIITLLDRVDRQRDLVDQFSRIGKKIDGKHIRFFKAEKPTDKGEFPSVGARGCFESHLKLLKTAYEEGVENLLIVEDDLNFSSDFKASSAFLYDFLSANNEWDFLYLAHTPDGMNLNTKTGFVEVNPNLPIQCTHLIGVSKKILPDLIKYLSDMSLRSGGDLSGGPMHVDGAYSWYRKDTKCLTYLANPPLGFQRSSRSDIADCKFYEKLPVVRNIANAFRKHFKQNL